MPRTVKHYRKTAVPPAPLIFDGLGFEIAGMFINNQSDSWLYVDITAQYVAPHTLAFATDIVPASARATVSPVASPTGGTPSGSAGSFTVAVYEAPVGASAGIAYDTQTQLVNIQSGIAAIQANTGIGGTLETDLISIIQNSNALKSLTANAIAVGSGIATSFFVSPNANNTFIRLFNNDFSATLYVGHSNAVSSANGTPIGPQQAFSAVFLAGGSANLWAIADIGTIDVRQMYGLFS